MKSKSWSLVQTGDGTFTLYSKVHKEPMHSFDGAQGETFHTYIQSSGVLERARACQREGRPLTILEIGLGMGYGVILTYEALFSLRFRPPLCVNFITTEREEGLLLQAKRFWGERWPQEKKSFRFFPLLGDARETLPQFFLKNPALSVEVIYQDPFAPRNNPELWGEKWFSFLKSMATKGAVLCTYSSATKVRRALEKANWNVEKRPGFGRKREMTRAFS